MTDDHYVPESLREAADPRLAAGAASRIADGAWARAASSPRGGVRFLAGPRVAWAAAAAVLVAVTLFALQGTEPAFAVEGDPVMVARGDEWVLEREVGLDDVVRVPEEGTWVLHCRDGGVLRPRPDSQFRFARIDDGPRGFRVEFDWGGGEFDGVPFEVAARDVVVGCEPSAAQLRFSIALAADGDGEARVEVEAGQALVRSLVSRDRLLLNASESAAAMRVGVEGRKVLRLARLSEWTPAAGSRIASGRMSVVDAGFGPVGGITLFATTEGPEMLALEVPLSQAREALARINFVARVRVACPLALAEAAFDARYVYEQGGRRIEVTKLRDGTIIALDGTGLRSFPDVAALRRDAPEIAELFGDALDR